MSRRPSPRLTFRLRRLVAGLLLLLLPLGAGRARAAEVSPEALAATRRGAAALGKGALKEATAAFEQALEHAAQTENQQRPARRNLALALSRRAGKALARKDGAAALDLLDRALELHPGRLRYERMRGSALYFAGRHAGALRVAQDLTARSPAFAGAWLLLADVQERTGELPAALEAIERALLLRPEDAGLERRLARVRKQAEAEERFLTHGSGNFQVRYDPDTDPDTVQLALTLLEDAYTHVTADLGITPETQARVVLYEGGEFRRLTGAHSWVGALYANGTLRVPLRNLERHRSSAKRVLAHEFAHHVMRERIPALPIWWHEGIAQFIEDDNQAASVTRRGRTRSRLTRQKSTSRLLTLTEMRRLRISSVRNTTTVELFYLQALGFVGDLVERFGTGALPGFLTALGTSTNIDAAARQAFGADVKTLWTRWIEGL